MKKRGEVSESEKETLQPIFSSFFLLIFLPLMICVELSILLNVVPLLCFGMVGTRREKYGRSAGNLGSDHTTGAFGNRSRLVNIRGVSIKSLCQ